MREILGEKGEVEPGLDPDIPEAVLSSIYRAMLTVRIMDERCFNLQRQGRIHFYVGAKGQEACHVASAAALVADDWVLPSYRQPGVPLYRGASILSMVMQLFGNARDTLYGRQMPNHYSFREQNFVSVSSPIGTQIIQAVGVGMAMKYRKEPTVCLTYFGDGATSSNDFHTGMNFAGVQRAPVVFFCENNGWAISVPLSKQTASKTLAAKAEAYGMPGVQVDGNDALAVYQVTREAAERARKGEGPTLIEAITYRCGPHTSSDDPTRYQPSEEVEGWNDRDPVARLYAYLEGRSFWDSARDETLRAELRAEINDAIKEAERTGKPEIETMFRDVYAEMPGYLRRQCDEVRTARGEGKFP